MALRDALGSFPQSPAPPDRLRLSTPGQILAAVPYLLGFRPERSGVVICMRQRMVGLSMRFDVDLPRSTVDETVRTRLAAEMADAAILVLFDPPAASRRGRFGGALADDLMGVIRGSGVDVTDALGVREGRFWSYLCRDRSCCPPHGSPVPAGDDADFNRVAAGFVAAGVSPTSSRELLSASVEPGPQADSERVRRAHRSTLTEPASAGVSRWRTAVDRYRTGPQRPGGGLSATEAAQLVADVFVTAIRDEVIFWCAERDDLGAVLGLCQELAPLAPPPFHSQLLSVLAWAAFCSGEGALASMALERALRTDPRHSLSRLLLSGLEGGIRPQQMRRLSARAGGQWSPDAR